MGFAPAYIFARLLYRIGDFFHHWYVDGSLFLLRRFLNYFETVDRTIALRMTLKYFLHPLYKDYTPIGRILGIIFRSARVLIGLFVYFVIGMICAGLYVIWVLVPLAVLAYSAAHL